MNKVQENWILAQAERLLRSRGVTAITFLYWSRGASETLNAVALDKDRKDLTVHGDLVKVGKELEPHPSLYTEEPVGLGPYPNPVGILETMRDRLKGLVRDFRQLEELCEQNYKNNKLKIHHYDAVKYKLVADVLGTLLEEA